MQGIMISFNAVGACSVWTDVINFSSSPVVNFLGLRYSWRIRLVV